MEEAKLKRNIIADLMNDVRFIVFVVGIAISSFIFITRPEGKIAELTNELHNHEELQTQFIQSHLDKYDSLTKQVQNIKDNDLHTIETKLEQENQEIQDLRVTVEKLITVIDERIPKKK